MTYYWVGSGTWDTSSSTNWSSSSGGSGGAGVPTSADDVIFDSGSNGTCNIGTVARCYKLTIEVNYNLTFTASAGATITAYGTVSTYYSTSSLYDSGVKLVLNSSVALDSLHYYQRSAYPFKYIETQGNNTSITSFNISSDNLIHTITLNNKGFSNVQGCKVLNLLVSSSVTNLNISDLFSTTDIYGSLNIQSSDGSVNAHLIQDSLISASLVVTTKVSNTNINLFVEKGNITFNGGATVQLEVDNTGTDSVNLSFATNSAYTLSSILIDGNATRNVYVKSTVSGTRARVAYSGEAKTVSYVSVKDIHVVDDDKIISYTTDSVDLGNNWQWYFDEIKKPIRNLFFGSHV